MMRTRTVALALGLSIALAACSSGERETLRGSAEPTTAQESGSAPAVAAKVSFDPDKLGAGWTSSPATVANLERLDLCGGQPVFANATSVDGVVVKAPSGQVSAAVTLMPGAGAGLADLKSQVANCNATEHPSKPGVFYTTEQFDAGGVAAYTAVSTTQEGQTGLAAYSVTELDDAKLRVVLTVANPTDDAVSAGLWTLYLAGEFDKALKGESYGPMPVFGSLSGDPFGRNDDIPQSDLPPVGIGTNENEFG
jgi:hypothetical protein